MQSILIKIKNEFLLNGHLQSLSASSIVFAARNLLYDNIQIPGALFVSSYLTFQIIYWFDRLKDNKNDKSTNAERSMHVRTMSGLTPFLIAVYFVINCFIILFNSNLVFLIVSCIVVVLGVSYPIFFRKLTKIIPLFKNFYVASFFSFLCVFPFIYAGDPIVMNLKLKLIISLVFTASVANQMFLDVKDVGSDKKQNLLTAVKYFGVSKTLILCVILIITYLVVFSLFGVTNGINKIILLTITSGITDLLAISIFLRKKLSGLVLAAGKYIPWTLALVILELV